MSSSTNIVTRKRCAVYCRVSSDERLDQSFNSIDAQKEAGHAFIKSQSHEGWTALPDDYDDPGFSGGNMDRPALKRLMADIESGRVDIVVVYKIDRLSRSLADFARMVEVFDRYGTSFSAVTQQINSATSMGRLMLNVLLSFAQFEREVTGERIRDKLAAAKAKGMWMGGVPPLGYDVINHTLVINEPEAITVRAIWQRFVELRSPSLLVRELARDGVKTKTWTNTNGVLRTGRPITKQNLYKAFRNPVYIGKIRHKGKIHEGLHKAIIDQPLWDAVQAILAEESSARISATMTRDSPPCLLRGLLFAPNGDRMIPTFTRKKKSGGKHYGYYISSSDTKFGHGTNPVGTIPAQPIEALVVEQVIAALQSPETIQSVWDEVKRRGLGIDEPAVVLAMRNLAVVWNELFPAEQVRLIRLLIERVQIRDDGLDIEWHAMGWSGLASELAPNSIGAELRDMEEAAA